MNRGSFSVIGTHGTNHHYTGFVMALASRYNFCLFETAMGRYGLLWDGKAIRGLQLPEKTLAETKKKLTAKFTDSKALAEALAPFWVQSAIATIRKHLLTGQEDLTRIPLDFSQAPPFHQKVYHAALNIPPGAKTSYGALAIAVGSPGGSRAVGQALSRNPIPLIVPCHRVLAAGGKPGGFSAEGGVRTKFMLLSLEGAAGLNASGNFEQIFVEALPHLKASDEVLGKAIDTLGPCLLQPSKCDSMFRALVRSIVYQQLSGKAASTIFSRFKALFPDKEFPLPEDVVALSLESLRSAGLSAAKSNSIKDLAEKILTGEIPDMATAAKMSDAEIIESLVKVKGIGPWSAEMLLIFDLGRIDVLPVTDYGVRKGFALLYKKRDLPTPLALAKFGERWKPYRSLAAWYLWRHLDNRPT